MKKKTFYWAAVENFKKDTFWVFWKENPPYGNVHGLFQSAFGPSQEFGLSLPGCGGEPFPDYRPYGPGHSQDLLSPSVLSFHWPHPLYMEDFIEACNKAIFQCN